MVNLPKVVSLHVVYEGTLLAFITEPVSRHSGSFVPSRPYRYVGCCVVVPFFIFSVVHPYVVPKVEIGL